jgi:hypothetical protein
MRPQKLRIEDTGVNGGGGTAPRFQMLDNIDRSLTTRITLFPAPIIVFSYVNMIWGFSNGFTRHVVAAAAQIGIDNPSLRCNRGMALRQGRVSAQQLGSIVAILVTARRTERP